MTTTTIDLAPITPETKAKAERWLKAYDGGRSIMRNEFIESVDNLRPTGTESAGRLAEVLAYAQAEKGRSFNMSSWHQGPKVIKTEDHPPPLDCGTSCCIAGTAVAFYMPVGWVLDGGQVYTPQRDMSSGRSYMIPSGYVDGLGREYLGLNNSQANVLFFMTKARFSTIQAVASLMTGRELTGDLSRFLRHVKKKELV